MRILKRNDFFSLIVLRLSSSSSSSAFSRLQAFVQQGAQLLRLVRASRLLHMSNTQLAQRAQPVAGERELPQHGSHHTHARLQAAHTARLPAGHRSQVVRRDHHLVHVSCRRHEPDAAAAVDNAYYSFAWKLEELARVLESALLAKGQRLVSVGAVEPHRVHRVDTHSRLASWHWQTKRMLDWILSNVLGFECLSFFFYFYFFIYIKNTTSILFVFTFYRRVVFFFLFSLSLSLLSI